MHVDREHRNAKFWLDPDVTWAANHAYSRSGLCDIDRIMCEHLETLRYEWDTFCCGDTHSALSRQCHGDRRDAVRRP